MREEFIFDIQELSKVAVICPNRECGTEILFDLTQRQPPRRLVCPACNSDILEVKQQERFPFTWISLFKMLVDGQDRPRMIFHVVRQPER